MLDHELSFISATSRQALSPRFHIRILEDEIDPAAEVVEERLAFRRLCEEAFREMFKPDQRFPIPRAVLGDVTVVQTGWSKANV